MIRLQVLALRLQVLAFGLTLALLSPAFAGMVGEVPGGYFVGRTISDGKGPLHGLPMRASSLTDGVTGTDKIVLQTSPVITTPTITGGTLSSPTVTSPVISNPVVTNGTFTSPTISGASLTTPTLTSPTISGASLTTSTLTSPTISTPTVTGGTFSNPVLTGTVTAPTGAAGDVSTQVATDAFVAAAITAKFANSVTVTGDLTVTGQIFSTGIVNAAAGIGGISNDINFFIAKIGGNSTVSFAANSYIVYNSSLARFEFFANGSLAGHMP